MTGSRSLESDRPDGDEAALKQWPVKEVARALNVSLAEVYLAKHRITARLRRETARLEKEWSERGE